MTNRDDYTQFYKSAILDMSVIAAAALNRKIVRLYDQNCDFDYHDCDSRKLMVYAFLLNLSLSISTT
jgi:hypothetical protein